MDPDEEDQSGGDNADKNKNDEDGDEVSLVKPVALRYGGFAHRPGVEEMVGGVDQPHDDSEEQVALRKDVDVEEPSKECCGCNGSQGYVDAEKVYVVIEPHSRKLMKRVLCG